MSAAEKCMRCGRRYRGHGDWNAVFEQGVCVGIKCPACQTQAENAEAVINEATIDYNTISMDAFGRAVAKAKA